jgi:hypothetical protein
LNKLETSKQAPYSFHLALKKLETLEQALYSLHPALKKLELTADLLLLSPHNSYANCGLVVTVPGYSHRDTGLDSRRYQIF